LLATLFKKLFTAKINDMSIKLRAFIAIGMLSILILGIIFWYRGQNQIQERLHLASAHVSNTTDTIRQALSPDFIVSKTRTIKTGCEEKSPEISFTRLYDCNATAKIELSSVQAIPATRSEALTRATLGRFAVASTNLKELDSYTQNMDEAGSWQMLQPVGIPNTAIAGVPPFNYYGGIGQEDIGIQLASKIDQANSKKTVISVTVVQEYHSCKGFFLPCAY
jgi:hypothetical protein